MLTTQTQTSKPRQRRRRRRRQQQQPPASPPCRACSDAMITVDVLVSGHGKNPTWPDLLFLHQAMPFTAGHRRVVSGFPSRLHQLLLWSSQFSYPRNPCCDSESVVGLIVVRVPSSWTFCMDPLSSMVGPWRERKLLFLLVKQRNYLRVVVPSRE